MKLRRLISKHDNPGIYEDYKNYQVVGLEEKDFLSKLRTETKQSMIIFKNDKYVYFKNYVILNKELFKYVSYTQDYYIKLINKLEERKIIHQTIKIRGIIILPEQFKLAERILFLESI